MGITPVSNLYPNTRSEQRRDAAVTGAAGALIGGSSAAIIGSLAKPDFFDFYKTSEKIDEKARIDDQKELKRIAEKLTKDSKAKLSKEQKELLEFYDLSESSAKEIKLNASKMGRRYHIFAMQERNAASLDLVKDHIKNLQKLEDPSITTYVSEYGKGAVNKYAEKNPKEFTVINEKLKNELVKFNNLDEALDFLNNKAKKLENFKTKIENTIQGVYSREVKNAASLAEIFASKKGNTYDYILNTFRNAKAKKYAGFGALFAGVAAGLAAYTNSGKVQTIEVTKPVPVPVAVPVPVPVKGKCPECKPCEEAPKSETPKASNLEKEIKELKQDIKEVEKEVASQE